MFTSPCLPRTAGAYLGSIKTICGSFVCLLLLGIGLAAPRRHVVSFGKWATVKWMAGEDERTALDLKIGRLLVDGRT